MAAITVADLLVVLSTDPKRFNKGLTDVEKRMKQFGKDLSSFGTKWSAAVGLPLAAIGAAALKMATDFDTAMVRMTSLVGIAKEDVDSWRDSIKSLSIETGRAATELGEAMFFITSAGARGKVAMDILEASAQAAKVGLGQTKDVAFAAVSAVNAYGAANLSAEKAVAILVATVREGNLEAADLAPVLGNILPIASELGVGFDQLGASIAAMTRLGADARVSATSIRQVLATMAKPTKQAEKTLNELGLSFGGLREQLRTGNLFDVLMTIRDAMSENEEAIARVFPNIRALTGVLNLAGKNAETTDRIFQSLANTTGEDLTKAANAAEAAYSVRMSKALAEFKVLLQEIGEDLLPRVVPLLEAMADVAGSMLDTWRQLPEPLKLVAFSLGAIGIAGGPVMIMMGKLIQVLPLLTRGFVAMTHQQMVLQSSMTGIAMVSKPATAALTSLSGAASVFGAAVAGWMIGRVLSDVTGLTKKFGEMKAPLQEAAEVFAKEKDVLAENVSMMTHMADKLGEVVLKRQMLHAIERGDMEEVARIQDELNVKAFEGIAKHKELLAQKEKEKELSRVNLTDEQRKADAVEQVFRAKLKMYDAERKRADEVAAEAREDLMSEQEVLDALRAQIDAWKGLQAEGIHLNQIVGKQGGEMEKLLQMAEDYGATLPLGIDDMVKALQTEGHDELAKALDAFDSMNAAIDLTPGKIIAGFGQAGETIESELKGGFDRGSTEGVETVKARMDELQQYARDNPLRWPIETEGPRPPDGGKLP